MNKLLSKKGFTLIELLVVIAIIGILTAIITTNFTTAKSRSRDAKRVSDIAQLQLTLEQFFDRCNVYPTTVDSIKINTPQRDCKIPLSTFISVLPTNYASRYDYVTSLSGTDYLLGVQLENNNSILIDSVKTNSIGGTINCSAPNYYCVQPK